MRGSRKFSDSEEESRSLSRSRRGRKRKRSRSRSRDRGRRRKRSRRSRSKSRKRRTRRRKSRSKSRGRRKKSKSRDRKRKSSKSDSKERKDKKSRSKSKGKEDSKRKSEEKAPPPPLEKDPDIDKNEVKNETEDVNMKDVEGSPKPETEVKNDEKDNDIVVKAEAVEKDDEEDKKGDKEKKEESSTKENEKSKESSVEECDAEWKVVKKDKKPSGDAKKEKKKSRSRSVKKEKRRSRSRSSKKEKRKKSRSRSVKKEKRRSRSRSVKKEKRRTRSRSVKKEKRRTRSRSVKKEKRRSRSRSRRRTRRSDRGRRRRSRSRSRGGRDRGRRRRSRGRNRSRSRGRRSRDRRDRRKKEKSPVKVKKEPVKKENTATEKRQNDWAELERSGRTREKPKSKSKYLFERPSDVEPIAKEGDKKKETKKEDKKSTSSSKKKEEEKKEEKKEEPKKEKRIEDDPPPKPLTEAEKQQQKKQIRLMVWKAKQQALKQDKRVVEAFENERKRLQENAKLLKEKREAEQKAKFEETEKMWAEKKKKLEMEMEARMQKRINDRNRKIAKENVARTIKGFSKQPKKIGFSFGKKPVAKPIKLSMKMPSGPPGLNSISTKVLPMHQKPKEQKKIVVKQKNVHKKEKISPSFIMPKLKVKAKEEAEVSIPSTTPIETPTEPIPPTETETPIAAPPTPTPPSNDSTTPTEEASDLELKMQQDLQAKLDPALKPPSAEGDDAKKAETEPTAMEVDGQENKEEKGEGDAAPAEGEEGTAEPIEEEEIDALDAFMMNIDDVRKVDDLKQQAKKNSEVIYNDDTVYEEEDLLIEDTTPISKNWATKKKELKPVDHLSQDYEYFQKDFYIEAEEIKKMTDEEVKKFQDEYMKGVKIHGQNCPRPIKKWTQCGLPEKVMRALAKAEYSKPFAVQCQTIPAIMSGRDVIGCAKTGSGKTCAFVLPMVRHIKMQRPLESGEGPVGIIISPTRELCQQIYYETKKFSKPCGLRVAAIFGGAPVSEQIALLKRGAEVIVCTPGRMIDMLCTNQGRVVNMRRVTYLVLDEADRMFDLGFEPQIMSIIKQCRPDRQICMFSATFPRAIENLARQILSIPLEIIVGGRSVASEDVNQFVELHDEDSKFNRLLQLLGKWYGRGNILIFHDQQESVDNLFQQLQRVGYLAGIMHGGVDQFDRENAINDFKCGIKTIMIATSVCSRGLDVKDLKVVINYSAPHHYEDYVHRIGRTGRAGTKGWAYTFIDPENEAKFTPDIVKALKKVKMEKNLTEDVLELAKKFKDKVRSGEEIDYNRRGFGGKGYEFNEKEAKEHEQEKMKRRAVLVPEQMSDAVVSQFDLSKKQKKEAEEKLEEMDKKKETGDKVSLQIDYIRKAFEKAKNAGKGVTKKSIAAAGRQAKQKEKKFQKVYAQAVAKKLYSGLQEQKFQDEDKFTFKLALAEYPEGVRRKMCSKNILDQTRNFFGDRVEIHKRGVFVTAGKKLEPGADPLHLLIQGDNEVDVMRVRSELNRLLGEAIAHIQSKGFHGGHGRYKVV